MRLYHNADIQDIENILRQGLLPLSETSNDRWDNGKRANNRDDVVYLFSSKGEQNSFVSYGLCLVEVDVDDYIHSEMLENDKYCGQYDEYTTPRVDVINIKNVYVPRVFKYRLENMLSKEMIDKIKWCEIEVDTYGSYDFENNKHIYVPLKGEKLEQFVKTAELRVDYFNYFRGENEDNTMIDVYNVRYKLGD